MKVYSIQPLKVWEILQEKGIVRCDQRRICDASFKEAYRWYVSQAKKEIPSWRAERPMWVWEKKPDMRSYRFFKDPKKDKQENCVIIELEIPREKILLSEFSLWHYVLSKSYLPFTEKESLAFDARCKGKLFFNELSKNLKEKVVKSWDNCLIRNPDHFKKFDEYILGPTADIQGIVEEFKIEQVVKVTPFKMINTR